MASIKIEGDKAVNTRLSNLRRYVVKVVGAPVPNLVSQASLDQSVKEARAFYATPKNKPSYPLRWKSDRQRIAVIIKLKKAGNLPYKRTGELARAWEAKIRSNTIEIANTAQEEGKFIAPFVIGTFQQPFHSDTGWQKRSTKIEQAIIKPITVDLLKRAKQGIEASKNG